MCGIFVVEVNSVVFGGNFKNLVICSVLENELFNQEECLLMLDMLPDLYHCTPSMGSKFLFTVVALHIHLHEFSHESLLNLSLIVKFFLYGNLHL